MNKKALEIQENMKPFATILLIVSGGIAAYKILELVRLLKKANIRIIPVLTKGGAEFVTPLSLASLAGEAVRQELFSLTEESDIGHIKLARMADLILIAPATANIMAKYAHGLADDLASTLLLASNCTIFMAPAMNPFMWNNSAVKENYQILKSRGVQFIGPASGEMACGEEGEGRLLAPEDIFNQLMNYIETSQNKKPLPLKGKKILITAGPTHEALDDIRYITNRSSGKQGYAIATTLAEAGAQVILISGPTHLLPPKNISFISVTTAIEMHQAVLNHLPADIAIMTAAVGDWRPLERVKGKIKKQEGIDAPSILLTVNPDILKEVANHKSHRPSLVIGFAAEAENALHHAKIKYQAKGCDWILVNDVGANPNIFGGDENEIILIDKEQLTHWPKMSKAKVAEYLFHEICKFLKV